MYDSTKEVQNQLKVFTVNLYVAGNIICHIKVIIALAFRFLQYRDVRPAELNYIYGTFVLRPALRLWKRWSAPGCPLSGGFFCNKDIYYF